MSTMCDYSMKVWYRSRKNSHVYIFIWLLVTLNLNILECCRLNNIFLLAYMYIELDEGKETVRNKELQELKRILCFL